MYFELLLACDNYYYCFHGVAFKVLTKKKLWGWRTKELIVIDVNDSFLIQICGHFSADHLILWVHKNQRLSKWRLNEGGVQIEGGALNPSFIVAVK